MGNVDKRGKLKEEPFEYFITKDQKVHISYNHKSIMILKEKKAAEIIKRISTASDDEVQLILAKVTGNFKHGNEK